MLSVNERLLKLAVADARTLARIDAVLGGTDTATAACPSEAVRTVTFSDAARHLGCSRATVYALVRAGRLDVVILNGVRRVRWQSVVALSRGDRPADPATVARIEANAARNREAARKTKGGAK